MLAFFARVASAEACGASIEIPGPMPRDNSDISLSNVATNTWGFLIQSYFDPGALPLSFGVKARVGPQKVSFKFSDNVTHIRISLGKKVLYEGKPINSIDALVESESTLMVGFEWTGNDVKVTVSDFCA